MKEKYKPYSLEQAQEEALELQKKVWSREAESYEEANEFLDKETFYENGEIKYFYYEDSDEYHINGTKLVIDALAPHMDHPVQIRYRKMKADSPGFNSRMNPEHRTSDYADRVNMNTDYYDQSQLYYYLIHELGHSFEEKIQELASKEKSDILPAGIDEDYADFYADLIPCIILSPEKLENKDSPLLKNTVEVIKKSLGDSDFSKLRESLENIVSKYKSDEEKGYRKLLKSQKDSIDNTGIQKPPWLEEDYQDEPFYFRVFEKIKDYEKQRKQNDILKK
jgi:hypothetical protein